MLLEAAGGDSDAAKRRLEVLDGIPVLTPKPETDEIVVALVDRLALPDRAIIDAAHIAISVVHGIDFLLTWNSRILPTRPFSLLLMMYAMNLAIRCQSSVLPTNSWVTTMALDPILTDVRRIREQYAERFHGDIRAMMDDLRRRHAESGRASATLEPKLHSKPTTPSGNRRITNG